MPEKATLAALVREARSALEAAGTEDAALSARLLVEHVTQTTRSDALLRGDLIFDAETADALRAAVKRRAGGEPVHRIIGARDFYGLSLRLSPDTLEPRPDTEVLVDAVLPFLRKRAAEKGSVAVLDLGTGTGAIALALLSEVPQARALASDISEGALETAQVNAERLGLSARFETVRSNWFEVVEGRFDAILSNPPYIREDEMDGLSPGVRCFDPERALVAGPDGLDAYRAIAADAARHLLPGGIVGLEIGWQQAANVTELFRERGFILESLVHDLERRDRAL
ncbi:MAG: peptide chain release factor N(5)-glutamine methyltransferase, partial [Mesorhizobium amorphae]